MNSIDYQKQLYALESKIDRVKSNQARRELKLLTENPRQLITELSREEVEVRRLRKVTIRYQELSEATSKSLSDLENFITFAVLKS